VKTDQVQIADDHADYEFAEDGWLAEAFEEIAAELGRQQDNYEVQKNLEDRSAVSSPAAGAVFGAGRAKNQSVEAIDPDHCEQKIKSFSC